MLYILNPSIHNRWVHIVGQTVLQEGHRGVPSHWRHVASAVYPESSPGLPRHVTCSTGELTEISPLVLL